MSNRPSLEDPRSLVGAWRLTRLIEDRLEDRRTRVTGVLELIDAEDRIRWVEHGQWHRATGVVEVSRELALVETVSGWRVRFADGSDFHPWTPGLEVVHPCAADTYRGRVSGTPQAWSVHWEVSGPTKDYLMTTELTPD